MKILTVFISALSAVSLASCSFEPTFRSDTDERLLRVIERGDSGSIDEVRSLVGEGASIDELKCGRVISLNMVEYAANNDRDDIAAWLIQNGADVNFKTSILGQTLLMYMAERGKATLCALLIQNGADVAARDRLGNSALEYAYKAPAQRSETDVAAVVKVLTDGGAQMTRDTLAAARNGYSGRGDGDCRYALVRDVVLGITNHGGTVKLSPALYAAMTGGDFDGAPVESERTTAMFYAAAFGSVDVFKKAQSRSDMTDRDGNTPLIVAARYGNVPVASYLLSTGADRDAKNNRGETAADAAAKSGNRQMVNLLDREREAVAVMASASCGCG